jgi:putative ATP-binding cassette transporter
LKLRKRRLSWHTNRKPDLTRLWAGLDINTVIKIPFRSSLIQLIQSESQVELRRMCLFSALVGLSGALIIAVLNQAAGHVIEKESSIFEFFAFVLCLAFYLYFYQINNRESVKSTQGLIYRFRLNIIQLVLKSDLSIFKIISKNEIQITITRDTQIVSQAIVNIVAIGQSSAIVFFALIYLATLSWVASILMLVFLLVTLAIFLQVEKKATAVLKASYAEDSNIFEFVAQFLTGFQEIKMSSRRARSFIEELVSSAKKSRDTREESLMTLGKAFSFLQIILYIAVGMLIFVVPVLSDSFSDVVLKVTTTSLFMVGSFQSVFTSLPMIVQAEASAKQLLSLKHTLEQTHNPESSKDVEDQYLNTKCLALHGVAYQYQSLEEKRHFDLGPITTTFEAGKVYFIRGQNGSGKTTLIRVLLGLYAPTKGFITVDNQLVNQPSSSAYRDLFAVVFSDFFLFKKLYGISQENLAEGQSLIEMFQLEEKVSILDNQFDTIHLSTGQRKRLGLLEALLEDKQFLVLDEWAADQDPEFRKYFYQVIVPYIKGLGKTLIAISHDDRYFDVADEIITIDQGKLI